MKNAQILIDHLRELGADLVLDGLNVRCRAPKGVLSANTAAAIREEKADLIAILSGARSWNCQCGASIVINWTPCPHCGTTRQEMMLIGGWNPPSLKEESAA